MLVQVDRAPVVQPIDLIGVIREQLLGLPDSAFGISGVVERSTEFDPGIRVANRSLSMTICSILD